MAAIELRGISQIAVNVKDVSRATAFYRDVLELEFLFEAPNMAFFRCGTTRLMLGLPDKPERDHPASILYYEVEDLGAQHEALVARDVKFVQGPHVVHRTDNMELWMAFLLDGEGNTLALMSEQER